MIAYSVVVPALNEATTLPSLFCRLQPIMQQLCGNSWEILIVDDGSTDDTWSVIQSLANEHAGVRGIRLSRNFGHHIAISAGLDASVGERVVVMDADLQHRPEDLPRFAAALDDGADVAYGIAAERAHGYWKRMFSRAFLSVVNRYGDAAIELNSSLFRMMRRPVVEAINKCRERNRYVVGLMSWVGFRQVGIPITYDPRLGGFPKYSFVKSVKLAFITVISFSTVPLRLATFLGLMFSALSFTLAIQVMIQRIFFSVSTPGYTSLLAGMMLLGGAILLVLGIMGEYIGHLIGEVKGRPLYVIREVSPKSYRAQK